MDKRSAIQGSFYVMQSIAKIAKAFSMFVAWHIGGNWKQNGHFIHPATLRVGG